MAPTTCFWAPRSCCSSWAWSWCCLRRASRAYAVFGSAFTLSSRQAMFAVLGVVAMVIISPLPSVAVPARSLWSCSCCASACCCCRARHRRRGARAAQLDRDRRARSGCSPRSSRSSRSSSGAPTCFARKRRPTTPVARLLVPLLPVVAVVWGSSSWRATSATTLMLARSLPGCCSSSGAPLRLFVVLGAVARAGIACSR